MKPIAQLKKEIAALREKARHARFTDPRIRAAQTQLNQITATVNKEYNDLIKSLEAEIAARSKGPRPKPVLPPEAADFLKRASRGVVDGDKMTLEHLVGPFYIWHSPGGTWSDNSGQHYGAASHGVIDLRKDDGHTGLRTMANAGAGVPEVSGRLLKAKRDEWLEWATKQP